MKFFNKYELLTEKQSLESPLKSCMLLRKVQEEITNSKKGLNPTIKINNQEFESLKFHKGSQYFNQPHENVLKIGKNFFKNQGGIINYLKHEALKENTTLLNTLKKYSKQNGYFIDLLDSYVLIWKELVKAGLVHKDVEFETFLHHFADEKHKLTPYRGAGRNGKPIEAKAIMSDYFKSCDIPATLDQILICNAGFKGLYMCATLTMLSRGYGEDRVFKKSSILVSKGYYHDLALPLPLWQSRLKVVDKMSAQSLQEILENPDHNISGIFINSVSNPEGKILSEKELYEISNIVLQYNVHNPNNPIYVISDEVYKWSTLSEAVKTTSIASISINDLGSMHNYTLTITSPSKTFGYATARVGIACSGNYQLLKEIAWAMKELSCGSVSQVAEITAVAAFALTPKAWVNNNNEYYAQRLTDVKKHIDTVNQFFHTPVLSIIEPQGGWFFALKFDRNFLGDSIKSSLDMQRYFIKYGDGDSNSGICLLPGIVFGYENKINDDNVDHFLLRCTLAVKKEELEILFTKIKIALLKIKTISQQELTYILNDTGFKNPMSSKL